jgi:hypothetical protein
MVRAIQDAGGEEQVLLIAAEGHETKVTHPDPARQNWFPGDSAVARE